MLRNLSYHNKNNIHYRSLLWQPNGTSSTRVLCSVWVNSGLEALILGSGSGRRLSKLVISRVIIRATPFRTLITLLITYLLSPLPLQVVVQAYHTLSQLGLARRGLCVRVTMRKLDYLL